MCGANCLELSWDIRDYAMIDNTCMAYVSVAWENMLESRTENIKIHWSREIGPLYSHMCAYSPDSKNKSAACDDFIYGVKFQRTFTYTYVRICVCM